MVVRSPTPEAPTFTVPPGRAANAPPAGGASPDTTRMLVARGSGRLEHHWLRGLPAVLDPGDVVVVNTTRVLPAAVPASLDGVAAPLRLHWSTGVPGEPPNRADARIRGVIEVRRADGPVSRPFHDVRAGDRLTLPAGGSALLLYPLRDSQRLWVARLRFPGGRDPYLRRHGQPIRYGDHVTAFGLDAVQTIFAKHAGSAEPPSAALAFDQALVAQLHARGAAVLPITLHTGVASLEGDEEPYPEWFEVPRQTAATVSAAKADGGRILAVGTTVTRALESAAIEGGLKPTRGWTDLVIGSDHRPNVVDGMLTGWHEPEASHLHMLEAMAGHSLLTDSYDAALAENYRWHAFGDLHLLLP